MKSLQQHSSKRGSDIHFVEAQVYCLPIELASLLRVTFGLVLLVSQSLTQQALQRHNYCVWHVQHAHVHTNSLSCSTQRGLANGDAVNVGSRLMSFLNCSFATIMAIFDHVKWVQLIATFLGGHTDDIQDGKMPSRFLHLFGRFNNHTRPYLVVCPPFVSISIVFYVWY